MTDKQIIIDGVDVSGKSNNHNYKLGRTKIERQQVFEDIKEMIENGFSLQNIADKYGVTRQAISLKMINCGFNVSQEVKRIKREKIKKLLEETSVNNVEKLNRKVISYKTYNIRLRNDLTELKEQLKAKEDLINKIEDIIQPYQTEIEAEAFSLPTAIESILECKEQECSKYKKAIEDIENICVEQNLKYDTTACEILDVIEKMCEELIDERL